MINLCSHETSGVIYRHRLNMLNVKCEGVQSAIRLHQNLFYIVNLFFYCSCARMLRMMTRNWRERLYNYNF